MKSFYTITLLLSACSFCSLTSRALAGDAEAGKPVFNQCAACHMVGPDAEHRFGPQLNGLMERGAGTAEGYDYSSAFKAATNNGLIWPDALDAYLLAPMTMMPGTKMAFPGLLSAEDRANVIAYLDTYDTDGRSLADSVADSDVSEATMSSVKTLTAEQRVALMERPVPTHGNFHLGRKAFAEEVAAWDIDVRPDGAGLPPGRGTAIRGGEIYDAQCASCHGVFGEGEGRWPVLAGGQDTLSEERPLKTIGSYWPYLSTVFDYIRRAMPFGNARSLSDDDVYAITAYLLYLNDMVDESFELNQETFLAIEMPNERGFIEDTRPQEASFAYPVSAQPCMEDCYPEPAKILQTARILDVTPDDDSK